MNMKVAQAVAIGIGLVTLILVPSDMLDVVRWGAVAAILVAVAWHYYRGQTPRQMPAAEPAPRDATLSAVLMVSVAVPAGRPIDEPERDLFRRAIMQCVRGSDQVSDIGPGLYSITLRSVAADMAERIGQRIAEQLQDLIVFDDAGAIKQIRVGVGGVASFSGPVEDGQSIARENLRKLEQMNGVNVLMSRAA